MTLIAKLSYIDSQIQNAPDGETAGNWHAVRLAVIAQELDDATEWIASRLPLDIPSYGQAHPYKRPFIKWPSILPREWHGEVKVIK